MLSINLLSWRDRHRKKINRYFLLLSFLVSITSLSIMLIFYSGFKRELESMSIEHGKLILVIEKEKKNLVAFNEVKNRIHFLQKQKNELMLIKKQKFFTFEILRQLSMAADEIVQFNHITFEQKNLSITGIAESRDSVKYFRDNLVEKSCFHMLKIKEINVCDQASWQICFVIKAVMKCPEKLFINK